MQHTMLVYNEMHNIVYNAIYNVVYNGIQSTMEFSLQCLYTMQSVYNSGAQPFSATGH